MPELRDDALDRLARIPEPHPAQGHLVAVTYAVAGTQYVAVPTGAVNSQWQAAPGASTITVFALR